MSAAEMREAAAKVWDAVATLAASGTPPEGMLIIAKGNAAALRAPLPDEEGMAKDTEIMREALERIEQWGRAYPLSVFPEPDFDKAREALEAAGLTLDAVSASNMRHVVEGVSEIARAALRAINGGEP